MDDSRDIGTFSPMGRNLIVTFVIYRNVIIIIMGKWSEIIYIYIYIEKYRVLHLIIIIRINVIGAILISNN